MINSVTEKPWCSAAIVAGHWIPLVIKHSQTAIQIHTTPEGDCFLVQARQIAQAQGKEIEIYQKILPQAFAADCGFQSLAWMIALVNDLKVEPLPPCKASQWRHLFVRELCRTNRGHEQIQSLSVGGSIPGSHLDQHQPLGHDDSIPALPRQFAQIEVKTVGQAFKLFAEVGIGILEVLRLLTAESIPNIRAVTVQDEQLGQIALPEDRQLDPAGVTLFIDSPCQMLLSEQDVIATNWPIVVALHSLGVLVLKRHPGFMCYDVELAVESFDFEWEAPLLDYTGTRMIEDTIAPNIVFLGVTTKTLDFWELLRQPVAFRELAQGYVARIAQNQVHSFLHWIEKIGVYALVRSCGWQFLTQLTLEPASIPIEVYLLPRADRMSVAPRAICQLVIERIFINQIKFYVTNPMLGDNVRVSLKLWRTWIWTGQIGSGETTQFIHHAWKLAHQFFGDFTPIRLVSQGSQINPDWTISNYVQTTDTGERIMKVHVILQLHGGGPPEPPPRSIHEAYSFQELEELEQTDVNRLTSVLIQNLIEVPAEEQHMDLEPLRDSTLRQDGPSFTMVGSVSLVVRFMRDLSATGIEALLRAVGWVTAMSISDCRQPVQVQLHLMPKAGVRHLALTTVRSFMAHALTIRAMPIPGNMEGSILVKVKLADSWVLVGRFSPEVRMAIFIQPWNQATNFFGRPSRLRIICNSAQANPDRCLAEYARTNELGERFAKLFLVLELQGGGPKQTEEIEETEDEKPMQTVLITVPTEQDQRLVRMPKNACIREAFDIIRPGRTRNEWMPMDSFGFPYDWDMQIREITCIHFMNDREVLEGSNGLLFLLAHHCRIGMHEIEFYLRLHAQESQYRPIPPICITANRGSHARNQQLKQWLEGLLEHAMAAGRPVASLCLVDNHWIPFVAHVSFDIIQVQTTIEGMELLPQIERCCRRPHQPMPHAPPLWLRLPVNFLTRQHHTRFPDDCGFQAIVWIMNHICTRQPTEPLSISEALQWRNRYLQHLACWDPACLFRTVTPPSTGGMVPTNHGAPSVRHQIYLGNEQGITVQGEDRRSVNDSHPETNLCLKTWGETDEHCQQTPSHEASGMYDAWIGARLCAKSISQLQDMPAPNPMSVDQLEATREALMSKDHRVQLLRNQGDLWADDEVLYHLHAIADLVDTESPVQILDPLIARAWSQSGEIDQPNPSMSATRVITALYHQQHWIPMIFSKQGTFLSAHTWAQAKPMPQTMEHLAQVILTSMRCTKHRWIFYHTRLPAQNACGTLTIALTGYVILRLPLPQGSSEVTHLGTMLRKRFAKNLPQFCMMPYLWASKWEGTSSSTWHALGQESEDSSSGEQPGCFDLRSNDAFDRMVSNLPPNSRLRVLFQQGPRVALDEMEFYLNSITLANQTKVIQPISFSQEHGVDRVAKAWLHNVISQIGEGFQFVSAVIASSHWIPLVIKRSGTTMYLSTTTEGEFLVQATIAIAHHVGIEIQTHQTDLPQSFDADCGFQSLTWISSMILNQVQPAMTPRAARSWRHRFLQKLIDTNQHLGTIIHMPLGGAKQENELATQLATLLKEHGVWPDRALERAANLLDRIPQASIRSVLSSRRPWADLKQAANQTKPPTKLIMQDELDAQIAARAKHRNQFGRKPAKANNKKLDLAKEQVVISASALQVPEGVFKQQDGKLLGPLRADQVGPNAEGVVLVDQDESQAVLKLPLPVTQNGLAVLVMATKDNASNHEGNPIRFPAMCTSTQEPLIAAGYLYQLGTQAVVRNEPAVKLAVDEKNIETLRCLVFKDQATTMWEELLDQPVRTVFAQETLLQPKGSESPVIDVWDRQWVTKRYEKTKSKSAEIFVFSFRMLAEHSQELVAKSGSNGIYYEPRSSCGRFPSDTYHVTWLPAASYPDAKLAQQTSPQATSLVRHADRYGLRSDSLNAQEIHMKHRPDTPLLLGQHKMLYSLGPLPYSTTKQAVSKLLKAWNWEARPLQPRGRSQDGNGVQWTIQATSDPSHWIYVLQHGDVLISKVQEDRQVDPQPTYSIVASKRTLQHFNQPDQTDPWLINDPWKKGPAKNPQQGPMSLAPSVLANIETNVEKRLLSSLATKIPQADHDVPMDVDAIESRVGMLEQQLHQLQVNQAGVDQRLTQVDTAVQQVQISQSGVENKVGQMQQQLDQQNVHIAQTLDNKMTEYMERIETLLAKRGRLGEAAVPGPHVFANVNPTGLRGKSATLAALTEYSATIAVQETHLTAQGIGHFKKELNWQNTNFQMTHGAPAPPKTSSAKAFGGKQTGVAFLSHHPLRTLAHHWTSADYETGRCLVSAAFVHQRWMTLGTVYGYSEGAHSVETQQNTDRLLHGLTTRVVDGAYGMRMISGDWNLERDHITQAEHWEAKGWMEAQHFAHLKWQKPVHCTCKRTTVKDFVYLSPEMLPYVIDVHLDWTAFADHAAILVTLSDLDRPPQENQAGFPEGFSAWWSKQPHVLPHTPCYLPTEPPKGDVATQIFLEFSRHYRELETSLKKARYDFAKNRRQHDPMLIYKDVQRERAEPVQSIVQSIDVAITNRESTEDQCTLTMQQALPAGMTTIDVQHVPVKFQMLAPDQIVVPLEVSRKVDGHITVRKLVGEIPDLLDAFEAEWAPRWRKHDGVTRDEWTAVLDFLRAAIPKGSTSVPPLTVNTWRQTLKGKRKAAAVGPDGISKQDMQAMPDSCLENLLSLLREVETGKPWPIQTTTGAVAALAKVPGAETVRQFRPICIFSLVYRVWSSTRARQCLQYLQQIVPTTLMGNIPGRSPKKIWFHIQQCVEYAFGNSDELAGTNIDLVKCFNTLPRDVLQSLAEHIGLPPEVMVPWTQALRQCHRRFQIRGATGRAIPSSTGYPEGCALSVVAMVICNIGLEVWMYHRYPRVQIWSFVDNIEALTASANSAIEAMQGLAEFCQLLDLEVDKAKSYCWATTTSGRKQIVDSGIHKKTHCRDLGGHMNYTRLSTNATIQEKIQACQPFWSKLARSCAPTSQKERALYVAAWANLFYGICTVTLGNNHFLKLRTQATKALNLHQMGSNPALQLSCVSNPCTDPELYCTLATILSFRDFQTPDLTAITLSKILEDGRTAPGPCKSFLTAIHKLSWQWKSEDVCLDQDGVVIQLMRCPRSELSERVILSWQQRILSIAETERTTMKGLSQASARLTKELFSKQPPENQGLLRCALNGTQFTQDALHHAGKVDSSVCKFCGEQDSQHHRHMKCSFFADLREQHPTLMSIGDLPSSFTCHGWVPKPMHLLAFRKALMQIPDTTESFFQRGPPKEEARYIDLFSDGSCIRPHDPCTRLSSWGLVIWTGTHFLPLANGGVPGWKQTSLRAEIVAVLAALKFLVVAQRQGRLWVDNQQVFDCLDAWDHGHDPCLAKKQDADLWFQLRDQYRHAHGWVLGIHKVQAHVNPLDQTTAVDMWATAGNEAADRCASNARESFPAQLQQAEAALVPEITRLRQLGADMHSMIVAIGQRALSTTMPTNPIPAPLGVVQSHAASIDEGIIHMASLATEDFPKKFRINELRSVLDWLQTLITPSHPPVWVSFHQLLVDYQMSTKRWGPASTGPRWKDANQGEVYNYKQHVQWFSRYLKGLSKAAEKERKSPLSNEGHPAISWHSGVGILSYHWMR
eukprot:s1474_g7.t1